MDRSSELKEKLLDCLLDILNNGVKIVTKDGKEITVPPPASYLSVAKDFLKVFPPSELPKTSAPIGVLKEFEKRLPFSDKAN